MDKLVAMRTFVEICDRGSLTAAADSLGKSQPTVVRVLAALEESLGVRLLRRTTRRMALTDEGRDYLTRARQILDDVRNAEQSLSTEAANPRGSLRITAPITFGSRHVGPVSLRFQQRYPDVNLELLLLDRVVNLLEEGVDLAVRIGHLPDSTMIARTVGQMRRVLVASPGLVNRYGRPGNPGELADKPTVFFRHTQGEQSWRFASQGRVHHVDVRSVYASNQATPAVNACAAGLGFGQFLHYQVADRVASGELELLLEDWELPPDPVSLVYSESRLMSASLRLLQEFFAHDLGEQLADL